MVPTNVLRYLALLPPTVSAKSISELLQANKAKTAVLVIDVQYDFLQGGSLPVPGASKEIYIPKIQEFVDDMRRQNFAIKWSQDWHPEGHVSFASAHLGKAVGDVVTLTRTNPVNQLTETYTQMLWPDHCVQNSNGAMIAVNYNKTDYVQKKGTNKNFDSYSAFLDDNKSPTGLHKHLQEQGIDTLIVFGLASDFCVKFSIKDAVELGYNVFAVTDLCHSVDEKYPIESEYKALNATTITSSDVKNLSAGMGCYVLVWAGMGWYF